MMKLRSRLFSAVDRLNRIHKRFVFLLVDVILAPLALMVTVMLVYASMFPYYAFVDLWLVFLTIPLIAALLSAALGIPNIKLKAFESLAILRTSLFAALLGAALFSLCYVTGQAFPIIGVSVFGLIFFLVSVGVRIAMLNL